MPFPISLGFRISGQAADEIPDFDLPLHLPLDCRRFCRHPSATTPTAEAVDAIPDLGRPPHLLPGSCFGSRLPAALSSPPLDSWTQFPLSVECHRSSHAGEVTLSFHSAVLSSTEAVDAFASLPLPVTSPAELRLASSFLQSSIFGLAEDRSPRSAECCRACSTGGETPAATELRIACPHRGWVFRFPSNFASRGLRRERISVFDRIFIFLRGRKCSSKSQIGRAHV